MAAQCAAERVDHPGYLLRLAELELIDRHQRMVERRIRAARFPAVKTLDTLDFPAIPSVNKQLVMQLARCEYIERKENVIAVGNSGTGKTHVALGLGLAACQRGMSVGFTTAAGLVHEMMEARDERRLLNLQRQLSRLNLLIIDELGFVPLSRTGAELLFVLPVPAVQVGTVAADHRRQHPAHVGRLPHSHLRRVVPSVEHCHQPGLDEPSQVAGDLSGGPAHYLPEPGGPHGGELADGQEQPVGGPAVEGLLSGCGMLVDRRIIAAVDRLESVAFPSVFFLVRELGFGHYEQPEGCRVSVYVCSQALLDELDCVLWSAFGVVDSFDCFVGDRKYVNRLVMPVFCSETDGLVESDDHPPLVFMGPLVAFESQ